MITFKVSKYLTVHPNGQQIIEVHKDGEIIALINADGDIPAIKIVSKYIDTVDTAVIVDLAGTPPAVLIPFTYGR